MFRDIPRLLTHDIGEALEDFPAIVLLGPRQVGKTTLAINIGEAYNAVYLDLENPQDVAKLADPILFFESMADRLVILDEVHRVPDLFNILRGVIDRGRRANLGNRRGNGRFLLLGSASIDLMHQSETLAGRVAYLELRPLLASEIPPEQAARDKLWLYGGFPDSYLAKSTRRSHTIRQNFIKSYLERDVPMFGPRIPATTLQRLWTMIANRQGSLLNASELARALEISAQSVTRYIDLLADLLLFRRLPPWHGNLNKRLVKRAKVYVRDSGLLHALLGISDMNQLLGHPVIGASWEGFVIENLIANLPPRTVPLFYRSAGGAEVDLVIEHPSGALWLVEIKRSPTAKPSRGFHQAMQDLNPAKSFIVHAGADTYPIGENFHAIGLLDMMNMLSQQHPPKERTNIGTIGA